jgi:hypothetical protein
MAIRNIGQPGTRWAAADGGESKKGKKGKAGEEYKFEALAAVTLPNATTWDVTPCSLVHILTFYKN